MKKLLFHPVFTAIITLVFLSCSTGNKEQATDSYDEEGTEVAEEAAVENEEAQNDASMVMVIWHTVADYDAWLPVFESEDADALQSEFGVSKLAVGRSNEDPNNIMVALTVSDMEQAKSFSQQDGLKAAMQEAGVTSEPEFSFINVESYKELESDNMARHMVRLKVGDYDTWKAVYDRETAKEEHYHMTPFFLGRSADDSNEIMIVLVVNDADGAKEFIGSDHLKDLNKEAGVIGEPVGSFYTLDKFYN